MEPEVSTKNTKNEIMAAYEVLLKKVQEKKTEEPKKIQEQQKQETVVKNASALSNENIVKEISNLKVGLSSTLDKLGENFIAEFRKFEELQQAIQIEKKQLEDLYQLSANTDSLTVMLLAQKEKKEQFEQDMAQRKADLEEKIKTEREHFELEMNDKKAQWKKDQDIVLQKAKEEAEQTKKSREREEEEFRYTLKITRKKETDQYDEKKQKLEKELTDKKATFDKEFAEREIKIKEAEAELKELRTQNATFPSQLQKAVDEAVKTTTEKLETSFHFEKELKAKETEGELKLKEQTIGSLSAKIKDMEASIKELSQKTATAESSVKDIAMKAIESSSKPYYSEKMKDSVSKE